MASFPLRITVLLVVFLAAPACKTRDRYYCEGAPNDNCLLADADLTCSSSSQCPGERPVCDVGGSGVCVQCTPAEREACGPTTPACRDNTCQACVAHAECPDSNVCLPDGSCGDDANVAYVDPAGTDNASCTNAMPCTLVSKALATNRPYVKLTGTTDEAVTIDSGRVVTFLADPGAKLTRTSGTGPIVTVRDNGTSLAVYDLSISDAPNSPSGIGIVIPTAAGAPTMTLTRVKVTNNPGGGISASGGSLAVSQSTLSGNAGGGISITGVGATFSIVNNYIFRNGDQDMGTFGGVNLGVASAGASRFEFNTVVDNRAASGATRGGGLVCDIIGFAAPNNIIARNSVGGSTSASTAQTLGACTYPTSRVQDDVSTLGFASPDNAPFSYKVTAGSSAIDQAATPSAVGIDHDGDARPQGQEKDIGADEHRP